jgi:Fe2+ transport system protein FeoA
LAWVADEAFLDSEIENHYHWRPMKTLADLTPSETGCIHAITGSDGLSQRLAEMGFTPGQSIQVIRCAPLGDPIQIRIRGFDIALRKNDARRVTLNQSSS